jgi:hypothetical protein
VAAASAAPTHTCPCRPAPQRARDASRARPPRPPHRIARPAPGAGRGATRVRPAPGSGPRAERDADAWRVARLHCAFRSPVATTDAGLSIAVAVVDGSAGHGAGAGRRERTAMMDPGRRGVPVPSTMMAPAPSSSGAAATLGERRANHVAPHAPFLFVIEGCWMPELKRRFFLPADARRVRSVLLSQCVRASFRVARQPGVTRPEPGVPESTGTLPCVAARHAMSDVSPRTLGEERG